MKVSKRSSFIDNPKALEEAKALHNYYTKELGLSNRRSFALLGQNFGYSPTGIQYWIEENVRRRSIQRKKDNLIPYSEHPRIEDRRRHSRLYMYLRRRPDIFLKEVYSGADTLLTLDQITSRLFELTRVSMRNGVLLKVLSQYEEQHGKKLLSESEAHQPPLYRLNSFYP